jgi:hypothetical protein
MDRYDQELLDKQMAMLTPPRNEGVIAVMLVVTFLVGRCETANDIAFGHRRSLWPTE